jgi:hypothetical protein
MQKEDLRLVEYINSKKEYSKGLFHLWKKNILKDGSEHFTGLIEDLTTGIMVEDDYSTIRFLDTKEILSSPSDNIVSKSEKSILDTLDKFPLDLDNDMEPYPLDEYGNFINGKGEIIGNIKDYEI